MYEEPCEEYPIDDIAIVYVQLGEIETKNGRHFVHLDRCFINALIDMHKWSDVDYELNWELTLF